jgi:hypothetical protein
MYSCSFHRLGRRQYFYQVNETFLSCMVCKPFVFLEELPLKEKSVYTEFKSKESELPSRRIHNGPGHD